MSQKLRPTSKVYLKLGEQYGRDLDAIYTFDQMALYFGTTRQLIYYETYVALGKLVYRLQRELDVDIKMFQGQKLRAKQH